MSGGIEIDSGVFAAVQDVREGTASYAIFEAKDLRINPKLVVQKKGEKGAKFEDFAFDLTTHLLQFGCIMFSHGMQRFPMVYLWNPGPSGGVNVFDAMGANGSLSFLQEEFKSSNTVLVQNQEELTLSFVESIIGKELTVSH